MSTRTHTHSSLMRWLQCPRRWQYEYEMGYKPRRGRKPRALLVGQAIHNGLAQLHSGDTNDVAQACAVATVMVERPEDMSEQENKEWVEAATIAEACVKHYPHARSFEEVRQVEQTCIMPMGNGDFFAGKIDLLVKLRDNWLGYDTKTTGRPLLNVVQQQRLSMQQPGYTALARHNDTHVDGFVADLVQKPTVTKKFGVGTPKYHQEPLLVAEWMLERWRRWTNWLSEVIRYTMNEPLAPQNSKSCFEFGMCPFYEVCRTGGEDKPKIEELLAVGYEKKAREHEELELEDL